MKATLFDRLSSDKGHTYCSFIATHRTNTQQRTDENNTRIRQWLSSGHSCVFDCITDGEFKLSVPSLPYVLLSTTPGLSTDNFL